MLFCCKQRPKPCYTDPNITERVAMIIDRIDPIALRVPFTQRAGAPGDTSDALHMVLVRVTTRAGRG